MEPRPVTSASPRVGLFVTCLVDAMRPSIGFATLQLLEEAGCQVEVPTAQTCCGQPAFNSGDTKAAARLARRMIEAFEPFDYVVVPSGSCAGMIKAHIPEALAGDGPGGSGPRHWGRRLTRFSASSSMSSGTSRKGARSPRRAPITTAARACANSASMPSPAPSCAR